MITPLVGPLLSSSDKDEEEISKLSSLVHNLVASLRQRYGKLTSNIDDSLVEAIVSTTLYYSVTSGSGLQTMGEEMNLLVLHRNRRIPGLVIRVLYVILQLVGTHQFIKIISKLCPGSGAKVIRQLRMPLSLLVMHSGGILVQYLLGMRNHPLKLPKTPYPFYLIIALDTLHAVVQLYMRHKKQAGSSSSTSLTDTPSCSSRTDPASVSPRTDIDCVICRDTILLGQVTSAPCGHVGCWECFNRTALVNPSCPICGGPLLPLLALRNIASARNSS